MGEKGDQRSTHGVLNICPDTFEEPAFYVAGFAHSRSPGYVIYIGVLYTIYTALYSTAIYNLSRLTHEVIYLIAGLHFITAVQWISLILSLRLLSDGSIKQMTDMINKGIYNYDDEGIEKDYGAIKDAVEADLAKGNRLYIAVYIASFLVYMVVSPVLGYFVIGEDSRFYRDSVVSPYMPHVFYTPFDPNTVLGFTVIYVIDLVFWSVACMTTYCAVKLMLFGFVQLTLHLKVLNLSLEKIQSRALRMYSKLYRTQAGRLPLPTLLKSKEFNSCLLRCLKANIKHHQTLLKYKEIFFPFSGPTLAAAFSAVTVIIYATLMFLVFQPIPISMRLKFFGMLASEQTASLLPCLYGDDTVSEGHLLFKKLYGTEWFNYGKDFKQTLHIMMSCTREPLRYRAKFMESSASRESFMEQVKATYSLMNLMTPSNAI